MGDGSTPEIVASNQGVTDFETVPTFVPRRGTKRCDVIRELMQEDQF
jgi:hypothetical protein